MSERVAIFGFYLYTLCPAKPIFLFLLEAFKVENFDENRCGFFFLCYGMNYKQFMTQKNSRSFVSAPF